MNRRKYTPTATLRVKYPTRRLATSCPAAACTISGRYDERDDLATITGVNEANMDLILSDTKQELGARAAAHGARRIRSAVERRGEAFIAVATGASQFEMLEHLVLSEQLEWDRVTGFHLDEYIGIPMSHPASFRRYLKERFVDRLPRPIRSFHFIDAERNPELERERLNGMLANLSLDVAFIGIGENGHIAFNDPPADFETNDAYIIVDLDEACRKQQLGEGWFSSFEEVPTRAVSMSVRQIMSSSTIICSVPDERKVVAVRDAVEGPITPAVPASILQGHPECTLYLDRGSASALRGHHRPTEANSN
jgi:glucosamine-6-phosphate deaminase